MKKAGVENKKTVANDAKNEESHVPQASAGVPMINLKTRRAVVEIPEDAVALNMQITILFNGQLVPVSKGYGLNDLRMMFNNAEVGFTDTGAQTVKPVAGDVVETGDNGRPVLDASVTDTAEDPA